MILIKKYFYKNVYKHNTHIFNFPKSSDTFLKKNDLSAMFDSMKTGGLSYNFEHFNVIIIALSNDGSLGIGSNFSTCDTSHNGITTFSGLFD